MLAVRRSNHSARSHLLLDAVKLQYYVFIKLSYQLVVNLELEVTFMYSKITIGF